jgi:hypothetical protein
VSSPALQKQHHTYSHTQTLQINKHKIKNLYLSLRALSRESNLGAEEFLTNLLRIKEQFFFPLLAFEVRSHKQVPDYMKGYLCLTNILEAPTK